jgi:sn-glycerol 3-phosphate transport system permease protein
MSRSLHALYGWLLLLPAIVLLAAFTHYPAVATLWHSFFSTPKGARPARFVGLENYAVMRDDPVFWQSLWNNLWFALGTIPTSIGIALIMALWVNRNLSGRGFLRMAYFTPTVLPMVAVANIWLFFYTPQYGLIAQVMGWFGSPGPNWLGSRDTALPALMLVTVWKESRWQYFRRILWPLLMPTTLFVLINALINAFRLVDHVVVMTRGGPDNASTLLLYYIYQVGFSFWDTAYAATLTVVLLVVLALTALIKFRWLDRRTHYQ